MPEWLIFALMAANVGFIFHTEDCFEHKYERCVKEYPEQVELCSNQRWFLDKTREWECQ